ncbi:hypothetical protein ACLQ2Q_22125 [Microbacterium sp. DT81.1]|uniref:hypothetical protein n=1 Tax=Microbacterium sp. DT81.1 TaxID=3393413 RepID=UPI003CED2F13
MDTRARAAIFHALASIGSRSTAAPAGSRALRAEIYRHWPTDLPHPPRAELVSVVRSVQRIHAARSVFAATAEPQS